MYSVLIGSQCSSASILHGVDSIGRKKEDPIYYYGYFKVFPLSYSIKVLGLKILGICSKGLHCEWEFPFLIFLHGNPMRIGMDIA